MPAKAKERQSKTKAKHDQSQGKSREQRQSSSTRFSGKGLLKQRGAAKRCFGRPAARARNRKGGQGVCEIEKKHQKTGQHHGPKIKGGVGVVFGSAQGYVNRKYNEKAKLLRCNFRTDACPLRLDAVSSRRCPGATCSIARSRYLTFSAESKERLKASESEYASRPYLEKCHGNKTINTFVLSFAEKQVEKYAKSNSKEAV